MAIAHRLLNWLLERRSAWRRGSLISYWVFIYFMTHWPEVDDLPGVPWLPVRFDLFVHCSFYAGWTALWWWLLVGRGTPLSWRAIAWLLVGAAAYAIFDETSQAIVDRDPDVTDFLADMTGATLALLILSTWLRWSRAPVAARSTRALGSSWHLPMLVGLQIALSLPFLKTVPRFYNDEAWEASLGHSLAYAGSLRHGIIEGWGGMHIHFVQNQVVLPFVCAALYRVAGFGIAISRFGSVLMGAAAVAASYALMRRWFGARQALLIALVTIFNAWFFEISRRVRPEIYFLALAMIATWLAVRFAESGRRRQAWAAGLAAGLAALAHPTGAVLCAAIAASLAIWMRPARPWRLLGWSAAGALLVVLPYVIYVLWAVQDPQVKFFEQMRGGRPVLNSDLLSGLGGEWARWRHYYQWPLGAPLALIGLAALVAAWIRSTRIDKLLATTVMLFALALPFTSVNTTSRYLVGLTPVLAALIVRLAVRLSTLNTLRPSAWWTRPAAFAVVVVSVLLGVGGIGTMFYRLHGADLDQVTRRIGAVTGRNSRVIGEMLLWMNPDEYRYGPFPIDYLWQQTADDILDRRYDFAVRSAWLFSMSYGVAQPPDTMPPTRPDCAVDEVCAQYGTSVAAFRDPYFGPFEVYRLSPASRPAD